MGERIRRSTYSARRRRRLCRSSPSAGSTLACKGTIPISAVPFSCWHMACRRPEPDPKNSAKIPKNSLPAHHQNGCRHCHCRAVQLSQELCVEYCVNMRASVASRSACLVAAALLLIASCTFVAALSPWQQYPTGGLTRYGGRAEWTFVEPTPGAA